MYVHKTSKVLKLYILYILYILRSFPTPDSNVPVCTNFFYTNMYITCTKYFFFTHMYIVCNADLDPLPFDCQEAYVLGCRRSGVYTIDPGCGKPFTVWCDMKNRGGWTVFQRRCDGTENFYRGWTDYENGFGNVKGEHWLGLKKISCLTKVPVKTKLRIDLADFAGHSKFACYDYFHVGTASTNYKLTIGGYQNWMIGAAGDSMTRGSGSYNLNGMPFSTHDRDNDRFSGNCASSWQGAWWYNSCTE